jgi:peptidoglycan/xylan/chitin deacetylase (PgdA/CDA1 family)
MSALLCTAPAAAREWTDGVVSLTFDDGLNSQLDIAVPELDKRAIHGTFYVTWENIEARADDWARVGRDGHEVADHSTHHPCDLGRLSAARYQRAELEPIERWLDASFGTERVRDFAYPCDVTNLGSGPANTQAHRFAQLLRRNAIVSARTSEGPPNPIGWVQRHPFQLQALALGYTADTLEKVLAYLEHARTAGRWAVLVFHEIGDGPASDGFVSAGEFTALLDAIGHMGLRYATVGEVMRTLVPNGSRHR